MDDAHFEPFVVESGRNLGLRAQEIFKKICNLITKATGQSGSSIGYFWKSKILVTLVKITHSNKLRWEMAHNKPRNPDNTVPTTTLTKQGKCYTAAEWNAGTKRRVRTKFKLAYD